MVTLSLKNRKALAQIPVLLGLLIMALVVPLATKLSQENQDNRNFAVHNTPTPTKAACIPLGNPCDINNPCCSPNTCSSSYGGTCKIPSTATIVPTNIPPTATPTIACTGTCQYSDCSIMGMKTATGKCSGPQYCCGDKITMNNCTLGERYCSSDKKSLFVCKPDKSGYTEAACATGRTCDSSSNTCVLLPTLIPTSQPTCLPAGSRYEEGKCCPGLVKATTTYGYYCGEKGGCTSGTKCESEGSIYYQSTCNTNTGYFENKKRCDFGCSGNVCKTGMCTPGEKTCYNSITLQTCAADGSGWTKQSCGSLCINGACTEPKATPTLTVILKQPGDSCTKDEDCASGKCKATTLGLFNKKCISLKASGDTCSNNSDCTSGICDKKICKEVGEAGFVCKPGEFKCSDNKTLITCTDTGSGWIKQACSSCSGNTCNGLDAYPVCSGGIEGSDFDCPANWACTGSKVPDKIGLWYCEPKSVVNANSICTPGANRCLGSNYLANLETCSPDGRRWLSTGTCPQALSIPGFDYSCKQVTSLEAKCRPATDEEMKKFVVEFVAMNAAAVAMPFAIGGAATTILPAMMANPAIVSGAYRVIRIGNAAYAINNAANECQGFESMNDDQKMKCVLAAGYAVTATVDGGLAGAGFVSKGSAILSGIEVGNDVANLALGGVNAYNQCQGGTDRDCYYALISSGIDLVSLGVDINQAKQWSKTNLITKAEEIPKIITNPENIIETENKFDVLPSEWKNTIDKIINNQPTNISILPNTISGDDELVTVFRGLGTQFSEFDVRNLTDNPQTAGLLRNLPQDQIETAIDYMKSQGVDFNYRAIQHKGNTALSPFLGFTTDPSMASQFAGEGGTVIVAKIPKSELFDLDYIRNSTGWNGGFTDEAEVAILGTLDPSRVVEIYNAPPSQWKINQLIEWGATLDQIYIKQSILTNFN